MPLPTGHSDCKSSYGDHFAPGNHATVNLCAGYEDSVQNPLVIGAKNLATLVGKNRSEDTHSSSAKSKRTISVSL